MTQRIDLPGGVLAELVLVASPHIRSDGTKHPNAFDARLAGSDAVLCVSETPLLSSARALLAAGMAGPDDTIVMRHAGSDFDALRARVGAAAGLTIEDTPSGGGPRLRQYRGISREAPLRIAQTSSPAADHCTRPQTHQRPDPTVAPKGVRI
jgi:hypothetical protein